MNGIVTDKAFGGAVNSPMSASRGILALQGIGLSSVGTIGDSAFRTEVSCTHLPTRVLRQDKSSGSWHPAAVEAAGAVAFEAGNEQAFDMRAARLRTAHQATVIRIRRRCRSR
ncbi:hypothetical protein [Nocardia arizonensis]|uniref:hypothetical protein n=1 Tax=Nocardia arizonensis TaxID=1141647 RepID=UPI0006D01801|nr:hypothetical protein [Nocardia arizonensis]